MRISTKILSLFLAAVLIVSCIPVLRVDSSAADSSIESFPKSYRSALTALKEKYPLWSFVPVYTGIDWQTAVSSELGDISLVTNSSKYSDMLKSMNAGDYNYSSQRFIEKDSGFVTANEFAVSYFMDPRNFLTVDEIFQFEKLSFDPSTTVEDVEIALKSSFMRNSYASYYDSEGNYVTVKQKYSEIIYAAGKKYNINPCFLCAKMINEVGSNGSAQSNGTYDKYPGIYNFFNIGANDGGNPAEKALAYASSGTSFGRPWTSPKKAIYGGAQFNSEKYIAAGQDTNYFQRFNVRPGAKSRAFTHQYMTSLSGSSTIAYQTYLSNKTNGSLSHARTFEIPVYTDMPAVNRSTGSITLLDCQNQIGTTQTSAKLRKKPTEYSDLITTVAAGRDVKILSYTKTSESYPVSFLKFPVWAKITYTLSGKTYTGYIYANLLRLKTTVTVKTGSYAPTAAKTNDALSFRYLSRDTNIAQTDGGRISFLKAGTVDIYAYDSLGRFSVIRYKVLDNISGLKVGGIKLSSITASGAVLSFSKNSNYSSYRINILDTKGRSVFKTETTKNKIAVTGLTENTKYNVFVSGVKGNTVSPRNSGVSFTTVYELPGTPTSLKAKRSGDLLSVRLSWKASAYTDGYAVYMYDEKKGKYTVIGETASTSFTFTDPVSVEGGKFKVRSYRFVGEQILSAASATKACVYSPADYTPGNVKSLKAVSKTHDSVTLTWDAVKLASYYQIYILDSSTGKYRKIKTSKTNSAVISGLTSLKKQSFMVRAIVKVYDKTFKGKFASAGTFTIPKTPGKITVKSLSSSSVKITWSKQKGVSGFKLYKYNPKTKKYELLAKLNTAEYTLKGLKKGQSVRLKIRSYAVLEKKTFNSKASRAVTVKK